MLATSLMRSTRQQGFTLLEVLITLVILAFGLLGLANLQTKLHMTEMEAYQRAQAIVLLQDFANRLQANGTNAAAYITDADGDGVDANDWLGTTNTAETCPPNAPITAAKTDRCDWQNQLLGAAETRGGTNIGSMTGARGCVQQIQAPNAATCTPGSYRVTVAWQGLFETTAPGLTCATGLYGADTLRRAVSAVVTVGTPKCL